MGSLFDKEQESTTTPIIPDWAQPFLEAALQRYSGWAEEGGDIFGGTPSQAGITDWRVGAPGLEEGHVIRSHLNPEWWAQNTGEFRGPATPPTMQALLQRGYSQADAQNILNNWGQDVNPNDYFYVADTNNGGVEVGGYADFQPVEGQPGEFWQDHTRPVVGPSEYTRRAGELAAGAGELSPYYNQALEWLRRTEGLDPNEIAGRDVLVNAMNQVTNLSQTGGAELDQWARDLRAAGETPIDIGNIVNTDTYRQISEAFQEGVRPQMGGALAGAGLGRSQGRGAVEGAAFAPFVQQLISQAIGVEEGNRAARMGGIEAGAGMLGSNLDRTLNAILQGSQAAGSGLLDVGGRARDRLGNIASGYFGTGEADVANRWSQIGSLAQLGDTFRSIAQERAEAPWEDWMRRAAAYEASLGGPMGMIPSTFGATSTTDKKANK